MSLKQLGCRVYNSRNPESSADRGDSRTQKGKTFICSKAHRLVPVVTKQGYLWMKEKKYVSGYLLVLVLYVYAIWSCICCLKIQEWHNLLTYWNLLSNSCNNEKKKHTWALQWTAAHAPNRLSMCVRACTLPRVTLKPTIQASDTW